jgi:phosphoribosylamine---glycine ligase
LLLIFKDDIKSEYVMEVLILGSNKAGAREHALAWKASQSPLVSQVYCMPGNPGIAECADIIPVTNPNNLVEEATRFAKDRNIGLTIVGPEYLLGEGVVDYFEENNLPIWGPTKLAAETETSKDYGKYIMEKYGIATARYRTFRPPGVFNHGVLGEVERHIKDHGVPLVIKQNGLANGAGVFISFDEDEALEIASMNLRRGQTIVVEEFLEGPEISTTAICRGATFVPLLITEDKKPVWEGGPNGGGSGVYTPVPYVDASLSYRLYRDITRRTLEGMVEEGRNYKGFLYTNIKLTPDGPKVLEYNDRFGDPEAPTMLPIMKTDLVEVLCTALGPDMYDMEMDWEEESAVSVVLMSKGYPKNPETGMVIEGVKEATMLKDVMIFHAGTAAVDGNLVSAGGRVITVVGKGKSLTAAREKAYLGVSRIHFEGMFYRPDIAEDASRI